MPTDDNTKTSISDGSKQRSPVMIFATIADTTWRMFVPIIGAMLFGLWLDTSVDSKPLYTLVGLGVGVLVAIFLVRIQIRNVMQDRK